MWKDTSPRDISANLEAFKLQLVKFMSKLAYVLARLGISQYLESFIAEGFETWETVLDITESDLDALNVKLGHRRKLQREIAHARSLATEHGRLSNRGTPADEDRLVTTEKVQEDRREADSWNSGGSGKRKYRRHPKVRFALHLVQAKSLRLFALSEADPSLKPDENAPERPPSAYVIFSNKIRWILRDDHLSFTEIAKRVGERWQALSPEEKEPFESQAAAAKEKYNTEMASYKTTESYKEYLRYLAEFKLKNPGPQADRKRPRFDTENSAESTISTTSLMDTAGSAQGSQTSSRNRVAAIGSTSTPSISSGYQLRANTTIPASKSASGSGAITLLGTPSNSSASPTPTPRRREQSFSPSARLGAQRSLSTDDGSESNFDYTPRDRSLPRIIPAESSEERILRGRLPSVAPEAAQRRDKDSAQTNIRRSNRTPAPLIRKDTSISSMSSNLSFATSASSVYTPGTPVDDTHTQRNIDISWTTVTNSRRAGDLEQPPRLVHPPLPSYSPSLRPTFSSSQPTPGVVSSMTLATKDIPQERRSLRNLSLIDPGIVRRESQPDSKGQSRDCEHVQQPNPYPLPPTTRSGPEKSPSFSYEQFNETDPLSILAYAGQMLDEEAHKPP